MLVGFHDGYFRGVRYTPEASALLWFAAPDGTEYRVRLDDMAALFVDSLPGRTSSTRSFFMRLVSLRWRYLRVCKQTQGSLLELATSDGCSVLVELKHGYPSVEAVEASQTSQ